MKAKSRSYQHSTEMLAGLRAGLGAGCAAHGLRGHRLAHSRTTEKLQREYDAVVIGAGNTGPGTGVDGAAPSCE